MNTSVVFSLAGMFFEYDEYKNKINIQKHGIDFRTAAKVFFDYDRIEYYDAAHSDGEDRFNTIGDPAAAMKENTTIGIPGPANNTDDILFVVYTERNIESVNGKKTEVTRLISARYATNFERGIYYGKC